MRLLSFEVQGFKNLTQPVKLEGLGPINVIHGPNNVGKSNLLQAIQIFFALVGTRPDGRALFGDGEVSAEVDARLDEVGIDSTEIFNLKSPRPIILGAEIETSEDELSRAGIAKNDRFRLTNIKIEIRKEISNAKYRLVAFQSTNPSTGSVLDIKQEGKPLEGHSFQFLSFLSWNPLFHKSQVERFALIGVERLSHKALALKLYDAKESQELEQARRWERFLDTMTGFSDILGPGVFVANYDRHKNESNLLYQTPFARMPLRLLGSGVQQCTSLIGQLLMSDATLVAIEEPELNLRYSLQERLRDVLKQKLVGAPGGPSQVFLTSHSPAFEAGPFFYQMERTAEGPVVTRRNVEQARSAVGFPQDVTPPGEDAANCYLSTDGIVRVPERIRDVLGLPTGGGVMFLEREGRVEMISDERFAKMLDTAPGDDGDEQP